MLCVSLSRPRPHTVRPINLSTEQLDTADTYYDIEFGVDIHYLVLFIDNW